MWPVPHVTRICGVRVHWLTCVEPLPCAVRVACYAAMCWLAVAVRIRAGAARMLPPTPVDRRWCDVARVAVLPLHVIWGRGEMRCATGVVAPLDREVRWAPPGE